MVSCSYIASARNINRISITIINRCSWDKQVAKVETMRVSVIELSSFDDMVLFLYSRLTTMNLNSSLLCNEKNCFTIISASDQQIFVITSPSPQTQKCKYAYLDDYGRTICSESPPVGRPTIFILAVKSIRETESLVNALTSSSL